MTHEATGAIFPSMQFEPAGFVTTDDGLRVAYYDFGGSGPPMLLVHATGFCAGVLQPLASTLTDTYRCFALDLRAHGRSQRPNNGIFEWRGFANDVLAVSDALGLRDPVAFGHSCGGAALLLAEEASPGTFKALYCFEPIVYPGDPPLAPSLERNPLSKGALKRRELFSSRDEALSNFSSKAPFDSFSEQVLAAYVDNAFSRQDDGSLRLRCRRGDEATIYSLSFSHDAFSHFAEIGCPVALACGELTDAFGPRLLGALAEPLPRSSIVVHRRLGHFGPLEAPSVVAESVKVEMAPSDHS